jgi:hypothetical protein
MSIETLNREDSTAKMLNGLANEIKENLNSIPEMNENEIKQLNGTELYNIFLQSEGKTYKDNN